MNLFTDELKDQFPEKDFPSVKERIECIERVYRMWELNIALGKLEDADSNIDEICNCMDELIEMVNKPKQQFLPTLEHLKIVRIVVKKK
jgi:hypothetical protein